MNKEMCRNEFFSILFYISNLHFINISITKKEMFFDLSHTRQKKEAKISKKYDRKYSARSAR